MASRQRTRGPLRQCSENPRYFADASGRPVYLTGSHTWSNVQEMMGPDPAKEFDYPAHLDWLDSYGFNFIRGWAWEQTAWDNFSMERVPLRPLPFQRTGPGTALDGLPKFDLTRYNPDYFNRLRNRIRQAGDRGYYFSVMLFNGWSIDDRTGKGANPWHGHPFNRANNINGIDGDPSGTDSGRAAQTLALPSVTRMQEAYVGKVVDTVNDLDNVLFEIGNEHYEDSWPWQCHMVEFIKQHQAGKANRHPVGMTSGGGGPDAVTNRQLFASPADFVSPRNERDAPYCDDPPAADGAKVIIADTDHLWGLGGSPAWVWKSFCRGLNPTLMDPYEPTFGLDAFPVWGQINSRDNPFWDPIRKNLAMSLSLSRQLDLAKLTPRSDAASSGFCLANPGKEYVAYFPGSGRGHIDLSACPGMMSAQWHDPATCLPHPDVFQIRGGDAKTGLAIPFAGGAVVRVWR